MTVGVTEAVALWRFIKYIYLVSFISISWLIDSINYLLIVLAAGATDCLERLSSKVSCYASSKTLTFVQYNVYNNVFKFTLLLWNFLQLSEFSCSLLVMM